MIMSNRRRLLQLLALSILLINCCVIIGCKDSRHISDQHINKLNGETPPASATAVLDGVSFTMSETEVSDAWEWYVSIQANERFQRKHVPRGDKTGHRNWLMFANKNGETLHVLSQKTDASNWVYIDGVGDLTCSENAREIVASFFQRIREKHQHEEQ
jgi:hypothetical protein